MPFGASDVSPSCIVIKDMVSFNHKKVTGTFSQAISPQHNLSHRKRGITLKISIHIDSSTQDTEIQISCNQLTPEIEQILATLRILNQQLMVTKEDETHILDVTKIIYIEAVERHTFVYTEEDCYESKLKLYEMEERLMECGFFRISKSCLVHLRYIKSLKSDINRKLRLTLENGEQIMVSRQYADEIKQRLGVV